MFDAFTIVAISLTFIIAGGVKGLIGLGLPSISLGLLTATFDLTTAMALMIAPSFFTNAYQAISGGNAFIILVRIWPFLLTATMTVWLGATALTRVELDILTALLGLLLITYGWLNLAGVNFKISSYSKFWMGLVFGAINGTLTGMTGSYAVPAVMFLQCIGLPRDMLIQAMGILFTASSVALAFALGINAVLTVQLGIASFFAVVPALVGMWIGQKLRLRLSEEQFRKASFIGLILLGGYILGVALV